MKLDIWLYEEENEIKINAKMHNSNILLLTEEYLCGMTSYEVEDNLFRFIAEMVEENNRLTKGLEGFCIYFIPWHHECGLQKEYYERIIDNLQLQVIGHRRNA